MTIRWHLFKGTVSYLDDHAAAGSYKVEKESNCQNFNIISCNKSVYNFIAQEYTSAIMQETLWFVSVCSGSVVVTAYDSESGRPGSNPEWGLIYYKASIYVTGLRGAQ